MGEAAGAGAQGVVAQGGLGGLLALLGLAGAALAKEVCEQGGAGGLQGGIGSAGRRKQGGLGLVVELGGGKQVDD